MKAIRWSLAIPTQQKKLKLHIKDGSQEMTMTTMSKKTNKTYAQGTIKIIMKY
jgi:hypothetical protein